MKLVVLGLIAAASSLLPQEISHTTAPRVVHRADPEYTKEALDAKLEGTVVLSAIIDGDGVPTEIKLVKGLGNGLDEKAVECFRQWRFSPALSHGEPIPVKVTMEVNFRMLRSAADPPNSK